MHIAFIVSSFPALSHTFIDAQIRGLAEAGHRVTVHAFYRPEQETTHDYWEKPGGHVQVHYGTHIPKTPWKRVIKALMLAPRFLWQPAAYLRAMTYRPMGTFERPLDGIYWLIPLLKAVDADVVVCHFGDIALRTMSLHRHTRPKGQLVAFFHGADMTRFVLTHGPGVYREVFDKASLCLPISERWKQRLVELGCAKSRLIVHRMGVDCARFPFIERRPDADGPIRLVTIARLVEKKGIEYAIRAIALLPPALRARIEYRIAGDGPLADELTTLATSLGVADRVLMLGWQDQAHVVGHVERAHLMLVPSVTAADGDQEGIPVSAMEAMASGLPVIATQHSGIPELVEDRVNGRLVPERDVPGLAEAIMETLEDPVRYADYASAARETVVRRFNQAHLNQELEDLLEKLATANR